MKNSAWYHKLWRKKLDQLPYRGNTGKAWLDMNKILDDHLPVNHSAAAGAKAGKPFAGKAGFLSGIVLPAAAMVCIIAYFTVKHQHVKSTHKKNQPGLAKSLPVANTGRLVMADSSGLLFSGQKYDSLNQTPQVNYGSDTYGLNNISKNGSQDNIIQSPLASNSSNVKSLGNPIKNNRSAVKRSATAPLKKAAWPIPIGNTRARPNFAGTQPNMIPNKNAGINLVNKRQLKQFANLITAAEKKPGQDNTVVPDGYKEDMKTGALPSSLIKTATPDGLNNNNQATAITTKQDVAADDPKITPLQSNDKGPGVSNEPISKEKVNQNKTGKKDKIPDQKSAGKNKPVKSGNASVLSSLFGKRHVSNSQPAYGTGFNYGIKAGYAANHINGIIYLGAYASFEINEHWFCNPDVTLSTAKTITGSYTHASYFRPDSIAPFKLTDLRKIYLLDIPLNMGYKLSKTISLKAGPVFSIPVKQSVVISKVGNAPDVRDTIMHTQGINAALSRTILTPKFNIGVSAGISIQVNRFNIEAKYQQGFTPYKVSSQLGGYNFNSSSLRFGIGFQLNKGR